MRDSVFNSLLQAKNRRVEPWASSALSYLNHPLRGEEALDYIKPALEKMKEVQKTGDIFFPRSWAKALLSGHTSDKAGKIVGQFFNDNPEYPYMLGLKIKQQAWHLKQVNGQIKLPSLISDNMVLQQNTKAKIWGWSKANDNITISTSWSKRKFTTLADDSGKWQLYITTPRHCTGQFIEILSGYSKEKIRINNILIGEVWLASGQSNMEFWVTPNEELNWMTGMYNYEEELNDADYEYIHLFNVEKRWDYETAQDNCNGKWEICRKDVAKQHSAIAFLFARELYNNLNTPIGIITCAFGGTPVEAWTHLDVMQNDTIYKGILERYTPENMIPKQYEHKIPASIWNGMVNPIVGYTVKGNIWYQAESNAYRANLYAQMFVNMVKDWRSRWGQKRLPFYIMQVAPYGDLPSEIRVEQVKVWEQAGSMSNKSLHLKDLEVATTIDTGDSLDIHPKEKLIPAQRFAKLVLSKEYNADLECFGPIFKSAKTVGNRLEITFKYAKGLNIKGKNANYLYIAGQDNIYHKALSKIENGKLVVWNSAVENPVYVKYCTDKYCKGNIYNGAGLPAYPFAKTNKSE